MGQTLMASSSITAGTGQGLRFHDLVFDQDLLSAIRDDGSTLRLSRQERALLSLFTARIDRLLTRDQLLAALSDDPGEISDRNVDFIVNRLRRKLGDPARAPRFIATRYGEGYVWIARPQAAEAPVQLLVIGPVRGDEAARADPAATALLGRLHRALGERLGGGHGAVLRPEWRPGPGGGFRFSLEVSFLVDHGAAQAAIALRDQRGRQVIEARRLGPAAAFDEAEADRAAGAVVGSIWRHLAIGPEGAVGPTDNPLQIRMQDALRLLSPLDGSWRAIEPHLAEQRRSDPAGPRTALMWAMCLFARLLHGRAGDPADPATYAPVEDEIERLALAALPSLAGQPIFALAAAKLLLSVHRGHDALAERIAEEALASSAAFAAALPVLAQVSMARGDLDAARLRCRAALALCDAGSEFELYLLVLKSEVLLAQGDRSGADVVLERIRRIKPSSGRQLAPFFLHPGEAGLAPELRLRLARMDVAGARALIGYLYFMVARGFGRREHVASLMAGPLDHLVRRFGPEVVPPAVRAALAAR